MMLGVKNIHMKITQHTKNCLELQSRDHYTVKVTLIFGVSFLAISVLFQGFGASVIFIIGSLILIVGGILAKFEMNCQFDRDLNLFKLNYRNLIRNKKIERVLSDISDVRLEQDTDVEGGVFYWLVIMMKSGEEIPIPHLLHTSCDLKTYELIVAEVRSFIHNAI
jgi:hypothetical protein